MRGRVGDGKQGTSTGEEMTAIGRRSKKRSEERRVGGWKREGKKRGAKSATISTQMKGD
jgi:hypothetical protein